MPQQKILTHLHLPSLTILHPSCFFHKRMFVHPKRIKHGVLLHPSCFFHKRMFVHPKRIKHGVLLHPSCFFHKRMFVHPKRIKHGVVLHPSCFFHKRMFVHPKRIKHGVLLHPSCFFHKRMFVHPKRIKHGVPQHSLRSRHQDPLAWARRRRDSIRRAEVWEIQMKRKEVKRKTEEVLKMKLGETQKENTVTFAYLPVYRSLECSGCVRMQISNPGAPFSQLSGGLDYDFDIVFSGCYQTRITRA